MKNILTGFILFIMAITCLADPEWGEVVIYTNSTVAYAQITIDEIAACEGDSIAAFVEGECRGKEDIFIVDGESFATMNIQGSIPELVSFQVWDHSIDTICSVEYTTLSSPGYDIGYPPDFLPVNAYSGNPINHYPVLELPESLVFPEDIPTAYDFSEYCSDPDNDELYVMGDNSPHLSISTDDLIVTITPAENWVGFESVTFRLSDGSLEVHDSLQVFVTAVNDPPQIMDVYPPDLEIEVEQFATNMFSVIADDIDSAISYLWRVEDQVQPSVDYIMNYSFEELGEYQVSCTVSDEQYEINTIWQVTVNEDSVLNSKLCYTLKISPNPCSNFLNIEWLSFRGQVTSLNLYNLRGRKIKSAMISDETKSSTMYMENIPAGIYFLQINSSQETLTQKITIK